MKMSLQQKKMKRIAELLSHNLSYIYGEKENGPNGDKQEFLRLSAAFLRKLGKDLDFKEMQVRTNPAGIAVSGSASLYGIWNDGNGLCFVLEQFASKNQMLLYREIVNLKECTGKRNLWLPISVFENADYSRLCDIFTAFRKEAAMNNAA